MALITEFFQMIKDMMAGGYPDYVIKNRIGDEIPVFVYHRVDRKVFEDQLRYLRDNGYQTLNIQQLEDCLVQGENLSSKDIVLTFDDGLEDLYTVAYPLLRSFGFQGVAFIAPYWVGEEGLVNWEQVKEMHQSGVIDFQAHSYTHSRIYVSPKIDDFFHPGFRCHHRWQFPLVDNGSGRISKGLPPFGMPIYQFASSLSGAKKYLSNREIEAFCIDYVENRGGKDFFHRFFWRRQLKKAVRSFLREKSSRYEYETREEQRDRVRKEMELSKKVIEKELQGKRVISFAYPYFERSETIDRLLKECGYRFIFGGLERGSVFNSNNFEFHFFRRINGDFIQRLPGQGKVSLCRLLFLKLSRRLNNVSMF